MKAPTHLKHKPILVVNDYDRRDGQYANNTDCKALSIGKAQWDNNDISAKIFRHTGKRWSRQSEEMPLHRCLDLTILILSAFLQERTGYSKTALGEKIINQDEFEKIKEYILNNHVHLKERLDELQSVISKYKAQVFNTK